MAQEVVSQNGSGSDEQSVMEYESSERYVGGVSSHLGEAFGMAVSAAILLGAVVGVLLAYVLGADTVLAFYLALGTGFIVAPVIGVLYLERQH